MALEDAGRDALHKKDYQTAADDFRKAAEILRGAGDFDNSASDSRSAGIALEGVAGVKVKAGDLKGAEKAYEGAAANYEHAGEDAFKMPFPRRDVDPQRYYGEAQRDYARAGANRDLAGASSGGKGEAAKNYIQGQKDYNKANENASNAGDKNAANDYSLKAEQLGKLAKLVDSVPHKPK
jgi:hypothetical protein